MRVKVRVERFFAKASVEVFDAGILVWLAGLNELYFHVVFIDQFANAIDVISGSLSTRIAFGNPCSVFN